MKRKNYICPGLVIFLLNLSWGSCGMAQEVEECLHPIWDVPHGPYLQQLCQENVQCLRSRVSYEHKTDRLRVEMDDDQVYFFGTQSVVVVEGACGLIEKGFELVIGGHEGFWGYTPNSVMARPRSSAQNVLKKDNEINYVNAEMSETGRWLVDPKNTFLETCDNISYDPQKDLLTADCGVFQGRLGRHYSFQHNVVPYISLYSDNSQNIIENVSGHIRGMKCGIDGNECKQISRNHLVSSQCKKHGLAVGKVGAYTSCTAPKEKVTNKLLVDNCQVAEHAYDPKQDTLLLRCTEKDDVYTLHKASVCLGKTLSVGPKSYMWNSLFRDDLRGEIYCKVSKPLHNHEGL